jgi:hypothetical protein
MSGAGKKSGHRAVPTAPKWEVQFLALFCCAFMTAHTLRSTKDTQESPHGLSA